VIVVTGGTGFVGQHLVALLHQRGEAVTVLARGQRPVSLPPGVRFVQGDVATGAGLDEALAGAEAVIHLVAIIRERGPWTFERVNVGGTRHVLQAAAALGVRRVVHMSALGARNDPRFRYLFSKWRGEELVRASGLDWTIFRPSVIFGHGFGFLSRVKQSLRMVPFLAPIPGSGRTRFQPIWVGDVAECVYRSLRAPAAFGQTYEIGGPKYLTYEEIVDLVLQTMGWRRLKIHLPLWLLRPGAAVLQRLLPDPPVTTDELAALALDNITALDSVVRLCQCVPRSLRTEIATLRATDP
jgi:NADH dehydrogenase